MHKRLQKIICWGWKVLDLILGFFSWVAGEYLSVDYCLLPKVKRSDISLNV